MRNRLTFALAILLVLALISCTSCNSGALKGEPSDGIKPGAKPSMEQLTALLLEDLARRGIDPDKVVASAPDGADNKAFDLGGELIDPDGGGPAAPTGVTLHWGEVLKGDYDQNGEVGISDLTPLGANFGDLVDYDNPADHNGFAGWPTGDPLDDGGAGAGNPPVPGSPAENWREARVDGDSNGEINLADITPIGAHFGQTMAGYCIYRKLSGELDFTKLPNPQDDQLPYTLPRPSIDALRPVRYTFQDDFAVGDSVSYYVVAYDTQSSSEGTPSEIFTITTVANDPPVADLQSDATGGEAPVTINFDGSASSDPDGSIDKYEWDLDGDGTYESDTGTTASNSFEYTTPGSFTAMLRVTDNLGATSTDSVVITVTGTPTGHSINGTIVDDTGGDPVAGVNLHLDGNVTGAALDTTTDANGNYSFTDLEDDTYTITPALTGYSFDPTERNPIVSGSDQNGIDFTAHSTTGGNLCISGRVGQLFEPPPPPGPGADPWESCIVLVGIEVGAWDSSANLQTDPPLGTGITDDQGNFSICGLPELPGLVVQPTGAPPSGDAWFPPQGIYFPFAQDVPPPGSDPNSDGQVGPTFIDTNNFT